MKHRRPQHPPARRIGRLGRAAIALVSALAAFGGWSRATQDAVANGDTRTISLYHTHSKESATVTFRRNGQYDSDALKELNHFLRDWRNDGETKMDPRLFDVVWAAYRESGSSEPINIVSAYRSPDTNAMLRRRSKAVAENSQHIAGKAMDFFLTDVTMDKVRAIGMRLQQGGVGFYPTSYNPFVHLDVGSVRSWPRMTHDQLARLFPDGKTVHLPTDGKPLEGYEIARAEILARGGSVAGVSSYAEEDGNGGRRRSLWATLFGGADEDAEIARAPAPSGRTRLAARAMPTATGSTSDDGGTRGVPVSGAEVAPPRRESPRPQVAAIAPAEGAGPWSRVLSGLTGGESADPAEPDKARALAFAPVPPTRPSDTPAVFADLPLPPTRPLVLAALDPEARPPGSAPAGLETPDPALFVPHGLPPPRPEPGLRPAIPFAAPPELEGEHGAVRAMFVALATEKTPRRSARILTARAVPSSLSLAIAPEIQGSRLRMMFSQNLPGLDTTRFSGPAVAPLPVLR